MKSRLVIFGVLVAVLLVAVWLAPVGEWLTYAIEWIDAHERIALVAYAGLYIGAVVLLIPGSILTLGAGFLFGVYKGTALVSFASVTGAAAAFLVGRFFARGWVEGQLHRMPRFSALDAALGQRGGLIVFLTRLSPVFPFNLLNYALGVTSVRFGHYVVASWVGMLPATVLYVYLGSVAQNLSALVGGEVSGGIAGSWLLYAGLVATLVVTVVVTRIANRTLNAQLEQNTTPAAEESPAES